MTDEQDVGEDIEGPDDGDADDIVKVPEIEHWKVPGAEGLPDEVRDGDPTEPVDNPEEEV